MCKSRPRTPCETVIRFAAPAGGLSGQVEGHRARTRPGQRGTARDGPGPRLERRRRWRHGIRHVRARRRYRDDASLWRRGCRGGCRRGNHPDRRGRQRCGRGARKRRRATFAHRVLTAWIGGAPRRHHSREEGGKSDSQRVPSHKPHSPATRRFAHGFHMSPGPNTAHAGPSGSRRSRRTGKLVR